MNCFLEGWHFSFCKVPEDIPEENVLIFAHHVWMRLREFVILVALELLLFQHQKQQENLKFNKLELRK